MSTSPNQKQGDEESGPGAGCLPLHLGVQWKRQKKAKDDRIVQPLEHGYREIAHLMAYKDSPFAIFRRFGQLNMLNLLCMQAELMELQSEFRTVCEEDDDSKSEINRPKFAFSFVAMVEQDEEKRDQARLRRDQRQARILAAIRFRSSDTDDEAQCRILAAMRPPAEGSDRDGSEDEDEAEPPSQYELLLKIRKKLKEYST